MVPFRSGQDSIRSHDAISNLPRYSVLVDMILGLQKTTTSVNRKNCTVDISGHQLQFVRYAKGNKEEERSK